MTEDNHNVGDTEHDGDVVLQLGCNVPSTAALEAAMLLARSLSGVIEGQFIEDTTLIDAASYTFTREITYFGGRNRAISTERMIAEMQASALAMRRRLGEIARLHHVELRYRVVQRQRKRPAPGPRTRFLALSQPQTAAVGSSLFDTIQALPAIEGFLVAGTNARPRRGPLIAVVRSATELARLRGTLEPLAVRNERGILLQPCDVDPRQLREVLDAVERMPLTRGRLLTPATTTPSALERVVRRTDASLVALAVDHPLVATRETLSQAAATLSTPLLLLRNDRSA